VQSITHIIADGISKPRNYSVAMPPKGGAPLSNSDVATVFAAGADAKRQPKRAESAREVG
jgi:hypothetical protein